MDDSGVKPNTHPLIHLLTHIDIPIYKHSYTYNRQTQKTSHEEVNYAKSKRDPVGK